jgi:hypothetical protein
MAVSRPPLIERRSPDLSDDAESDVDNESVDAADDLLEEDELEATIDEDHVGDSGRPRRRRCYIGNCRVDKKQTTKSQYLCDHTCCRAFVYTYGKKTYQGKYFCSTCFDEHRSEILKTLVSSMTSI